MGDFIEKSRAEILFIERPDDGGLMADAGKNDGVSAFEFAGLRDTFCRSTEFLQSALDGWDIARTIVDECNGTGGIHRSSFVLGRIFLRRRSRLTAKRSARAKALNNPST